MRRRSDTTQRALNHVAYGSTVRQEVQLSSVGRSRAPAGSVAGIREYFGERSSGWNSETKLAGPQAFLVEGLPAGYHNDAHFHDVDQYQVFFGEDAAWYQREVLAPVTVHYSDAYKTYGPFGSGRGSLSFFTLRPAESSITAYMPGSREQLVRVGRRSLHAEVAVERVREGEAVRRKPVLNSDDGMAVTSHGAPDGARLIVGSDSASQGTYGLVLAGAFRTADGTTLRERSLIWTNPGEGVEATADGPASLLTMQFPRQTYTNFEDRRSEP